MGEVRGGAVGRTERHGAAVIAGMVAGLAGLVTFLAIHHVWIRPIWFIAPVGVVIAVGGGAVVGGAYGELRALLPVRNWAAALAGIAGTAAILTPSFLLAQARGPVFRMLTPGASELLVPPETAVFAFGIELLAVSSLVGGLVGAVVGRTRRAAGATAAAAFAFALGPGHNIPFLGRSGAEGKESALIAAIVIVAWVVLVEVEGRLSRAPVEPGDASARTID